MLASSIRLWVIDLSRLTLSLTQPYSVLQGYMYLTNSYLCFFAHMPAREVLHTRHCRYSAEIVLVFYRIRSWSLVRCTKKPNALNAGLSIGLFWRTMCYRGTNHPLQVSISSANTVWKDLFSPVAGPLFSSWGCWPSLCNFMWTSERQGYSSANKYQNDLLVCRFDP